MPNFIKNRQTVAEIWRFNCFQNGGRPPSWILEIQIFLTVCTVKRPILHNRARFREDLPIRCCNIVIFVFFQDGGRRHLGFSKIRNFNGLYPVGGQSASPCQISSKSVKRLPRYGDLTVFKMAAVRHLGFWKFNFF